MTDDVNRIELDDLEAIRVIRDILEPFGPYTRQQILNYLIGQYQLAAIGPSKIMSEGTPKYLGRAGDFAKVG